MVSKSNNNQTLARYALAYIKKTGSSENIEGFLSHCKEHSWSEEKFNEIYFSWHQNRNLTTDQQDEAFSAQQSTPINTGKNRSTNTHTHIHVHTDRPTQWNFWDCLLLQCCINNLFHGGGRTTVNNTTYVNYGSASQQQNNQSRKEEAQDGRALIALGIVVVAVVIIFHTTICYFYNESKKDARESENINSLDGKLKTFRNIEFLVCATSLIGLVGCAIYPVLPVWGLVAIGANSLICFLGGLAFQMKHDKESDDIKKVESAVREFQTCPTAPHFNSTDVQDFQSVKPDNNCPPPPYSEYPTAPPASSVYDHNITKGCYTSQGR
ncbi:MAG: hypothetical protein QWI36_00495 [Wolbachia endosymbiont of Tyrophagus putrescentiae]|nr:hypothetical protein [Wolbachia endosymbiont of Tyrophagus putrescentiae]